jgi:dimethylglycine dehydrogenase
LAVYNAILEAGTEYGITDYGSFAMNTMRMEKMFKGAGELTNEVTLPEADVMRFVNMDKDFIGKEATVQSNNNELPWICAYLQIDPNHSEDGNGGEAVLLNDEVVGSTSSIVYSHTVKSILAFAYLKPYAAAAGTELNVIIAGKSRKAVVLEQAAYDPRSELPRTNSL